MNDMKRLFTKAAKLGVGIELNYGKLETPVNGYTKLISKNISRNIFETQGNETTLGYTKICEITTTKKYDYATCKISAIDVMTDGICQCDLYIKVKQELDISNNPLVVLVCKNEVEDNTKSKTVLTYKNFFATVKKYRDNNVVEIYYKFDKNYCRVQFEEEQQFVIGNSKIRLSKKVSSILSKLTGDIISCS